MTTDVRKASEKTLSDIKVRNAAPKEKPYRLFDGDGLALWVSPTGVKSWQLRYRLNDTAKRRRSASTRH